MARLAEPLMSQGGALLTMSYYGADKVVNHYNVMGPVSGAASDDALSRRRARRQGDPRLCGFARPLEDARGERHRRFR